MMVDGQHRSQFVPMSARRDAIRRMEERIQRMETERGHLTARINGYQRQLNEAKDKFVQDYKETA